MYREDASVLVLTDKNLILRGYRRAMFQQSLLSGNLGSICGIAGEWDWGGGPSVANVIAMIEAIAHRGPKGHTCWLSPDRKLALAQAQLSFFKGAETQPVSNSAGTIFAVCNGETSPRIF